MTQAAVDAYKFGKFRFETKNEDFPVLYLEQDNEEVRLSPKERQVLLFLIKNRHKSYNAGELLDECWGEYAEIEENNATRTISSLRKSLGEKVGENKYIQTLDKKYRFVAEVVEIKTSGDVLAPQGIISKAPMPDIAEPLEQTVINADLESVTEELNINRVIPENIPAGNPSPANNDLDENIEIETKQEEIKDEPPENKEEILGDLNQELNDPLSTREAAVKSREELMRFGAWLSGSGKTIKWILLICVVLTFFTSLYLTLVPIKNSQEFTADDFKEPKSLAGQLSADQKGVISTYLCDRNKTVNELVCVIKTSEQSNEQLTEKLKNIFNESIKDESLYNRARFENVTLSEQSKELIKQVVEQKINGDFASLNRSLLQDAYPTEIRKNTTATWGKPIAALLQFLTIFIILWYARKNFQQNDFSYLGDNKIDEKVKDVLQIIRKYWLWLFFMWFLLYLVLFFYYAEESFHLSKVFSVTPERFSLGVNLLFTVFNYVNTVLIVYCFLYLNEQGETDKESRKD